MKPFLRFKQFLQEDVEPQIYARSIWVVGRPGSGKSMFANLLKKNFPSLQIVDSDSQFGTLLKKAGIDPDLRDMDDAKQKQIADIRKKAIDLSGKRWQTLTGLRSTKAGEYNEDNAFVYVGTGVAIGWLEKKIEEFRAWGFKPFIVYVNTPADTAKDRNLKRDRKLDNSVIDAYDKNHANMGGGDRAELFKKIVGERNFIELYNDKPLGDEQAINKKFPAFIPRLKKFLSTRK